MGPGDVQEKAVEVAAALPAAALEHPFGPEWDVFKVGGRIFLIVTELRGEGIVVLKCEPEHSAALRAGNPAVTPGYHMDKRHWITLHGTTGMTPELVDELVSNSYELVVAKLPARSRPVDPRRRHEEGMR
jgi:predicted DNA-binding protein (MmcQ/YjbR family)